MGDNPGAGLLKFLFMLALEWSILDSITYLLNLF